MLAEREEKEAAADAGNLMAYNNNIDEGWVKRRLRKCCTTCVTRLAFIREERVHPLYWGEEKHKQQWEGGGEREKNMYGIVVVCPPIRLGWRVIAVRQFR